MLLQHVLTLIPSVADAFSVIATQKSFESDKISQSNLVQCKSIEKEKRKKTGTWSSWTNINDVIENVIQSR